MGLYLRHLGSFTFLLTLALSFSTSPATADPLIRKNCNASLDPVFVGEVPEPKARNSTLTALLKLYPNLTPAQLEEKLAAVESEFMFFRGFAPVFYRRLAANAEWLKSIQKLLDHSGWLVGDAHPENFGFLTLEEKLKFTTNDLDDAGPGPVVLDLVRFISAVKVLSPGIDLKPIIEAYHHALTHERKLDDVIYELREKAHKKGRKMPKNLVTDADEIDRTNPEVSEVDSPTAAKIRARLVSLFPGIEVKDVVRIKRTTGGSAFRARFLAQIKADGELILIELKAIEGPAIGEFVGKSALMASRSEKQRLESALDLQQGAHRVEFYRTTLIDGAPFLVRPRFAGNQPIKLADFDPAQYPDLFAAEAEALARFHRKTIERIEEYAGSVDAVAIARWDELARALSTDSNRWFNAVRN